MARLSHAAQAMSQDRERSLKSECSGCLTKPVDRTLLLSRLAAQMNGSCLVAASEAAPSRAPRILRSTLAYDPDISSFLPAYVADLPNMAHKLQTLLHQQDLAAIRGTAHQIKGTSGFYGFLPISDAAEQVENVIGATGQIEQVEQKVRWLIDLVRNVEGYDRAKEASATNGAPGVNL